MYPVVIWLARHISEVNVAWKLEILPTPGVGLITCLDQARLQFYCCTWPLRILVLVMKFSGQYLLAFERAYLW